MKKRLLQLCLAGFGVLNVLVVSFVAPHFFGDQLLWTPRNRANETMISALYVAMGVAMLAASRKPEGAQSLVDFLVIGNVLHAAVMLIFAETLTHIVFDVIPIGVMGVAPLLFYPWGLRGFLQYR